MFCSIDYSKSLWHRFSHICASLESLEFSDIAPLPLESSEEPQAILGIILHPIPTNRPCAIHAHSYSAGSYRQTSKGNEIRLSCIYSVWSVLIPFKFFLFLGNWLLQKWTRHWRRKCRGRKRGEGTEGDGGMAGADCQDANLGTICRTSYSRVRIFGHNLRNAALGPDSIHWVESPVDRIRFSSCRLLSIDSIIKNSVLWNSRFTRLLYFFLRRWSNIVLRSYRAMEMISPHLRMPAFTHKSCLNIVRWTRVYFEIAWNAALWNSPQLVSENVVVPHAVNWDFWFGDYQRKFLPFLPRSFCYFQFCPRQAQASGLKNSDLTHSERQSLCFFWKSWHYASP